MIWKVPLPFEDHVKTLGRDIRSKNNFLSLFKPVCGTYNSPYKLIRWLRGVRTESCNPGIQARDVPRAHTVALHWYSAWIWDQVDPFSLSKPLQGQEEGEAQGPNTGFTNTGGRLT